MNSIFRSMVDPDTLEAIDIIMPDEEWFASQADPQIIRDKVAAQATAEVAKQADLDELRAGKVAAALAAIAADLSTIDSAANSQVRDMLKRALQREQVIIKALMRLSN